MQWVHKTLFYVVTNRISRDGPLRFLDLVCALLGKMVEISVEAKMYYGVAGCMCAHNLCCFRSRVHHW